MPDFTVHTIPGSPFGRAVLIALEEKAASYRVQRVLPTEMRSAAHLARHPFGRVPVLEHDGFALYETQAILRYLDRVVQDPALTPADPRAAARMDQAMNISDWYLFQGAVSVIGFQRIVGPRLLGMTPDEEAIAKALPRARTALGTLSGMLDGQAYIAGPTVSLADALLGPMFAMLAATPEWHELTAPHPNLTAYQDRLSARPSFAATTWERVEAMANPDRQTS